MRLEDIYIVNWVSKMLGYLGGGGGGGGGGVVGVRWGYLLFITHGVDHLNSLY